MIDGRGGKPDRLYGRESPPGLRERRQDFDSFPECRDIFLLSADRAQRPPIRDPGAGPFAAVAQEFFVLCDCLMEIAHLVKRGSPEFAVERIGRIATEQRFDYRQRKVSLLPGEQYDRVAEQAGLEIGPNFTKARQ